MSFLATVIDSQGAPISYAARAARIENLPSDEEIRSQWIQLSADEAAMHEMKTRFNLGPDYDFEPVPLSIDMDSPEMRPLGVGMGLYLRFTRLAGALLLLLGFLSIPGLLFFIDRGVKDDPFLGRNKPTGSIWFYTSYGGIGKTVYPCPPYDTSGLPNCRSPSFLTSIMLAVQTLLYTIFVLWIRASNRRSADEINKELDTTSDYAIHINGLPIELSDPSPLVSYFSNFGQVEQVAVSFDADELEEAAQERERLYFLYGIIRGRELLDEENGEDFAPCCGGCPCYCCCKSCLSSETVLAAFAESNVRFRMLSAYSYDSTGHAFVTFSYERDTNTCIQYHNQPFWFDLIGSLCCRPLPVDPSKYGLGNKKPSVKRAEEPSDVIWFNLRFGFWTRLFRRFLLTLIAFVLMAATAGLLYWLEQRRREQLGETSLRVRLLGLGIAFGVVLINKLLVFLLKGFSSWERHHSRTTQNQASLNKLALSQFINSAVLVLLINEAWRRSDVPSHDFYIIAADSVVTIVAINIAVTLVFQLFRKYTHGCSRCFRVSFVVTQYELNKAVEGPEMDLDERCAYVLKTLLICSLFGTSFPVVYFFGSIGLFFNAFIDKYNLLRVYRCPPKYDDSLSRTTQNLASLGLFCHAFFAAGNSYFYAQLPLYSTHSLIAFGCLLVSVVVLIYSYFPRSLLRYFVDCFLCGTLSAKAAGVREDDSDTRGAPFDPTRMDRFRPPASSLSNQWLRSAATRTVPSALPRTAWLSAEGHTSEIHDSMVEAENEVPSASRPQNQQWIHAFVASGYSNAEAAQHPEVVAQQAIQTVQQFNAENEPNGAPALLSRRSSYHLPTNSVLEKTQEYEQKFAAVPPPRSRARVQQESSSLSEARMTDEQMVDLFYRFYLLALDAGLDDAQAQEYGMRQLHAICFG